MMTDVKVARFVAIERHFTMMVYWRHLSKNTSCDLAF